MMEVSVNFSFPPELIDVFAEDSENDRTFYGFDDSQLSDPCEKDEDEDEAKQERSPEQQSSTSRRPTRAQPFRLRVALRSASAARKSSGDEEDTGEEEERPQRRRARKPGKLSHAMKEKHVKFEDEETAAAGAQRPSPPEERGSDPEGDAADSFLAKREQNIKANKAMLAQLMADLQMMPGGAGLLKKQAAKQPKDKKSQRPPRSDGGSRRNPERASRRTTRSMGLNGSEAPKEEEEELELTLEDELLEVRGTPRRRAAPRPKSSKPHIIRPVEDITDYEIELVADNMTEKVYNSATGSTCHQCRQKTIDTKTCCRSEDCRGIQGQFCGPCLRNRYGEDVRKALKDPEWRCPPCRGICNCSFCRQRDGRCPTGILFPLAQYHGFSDVHSYLTSLRSKIQSENDMEM